MSEDLSEVRRRLKKIQSIGGGLLSQSTYALRALDRAEADADGGGGGSNEDTPTTITLADNAEDNLTTLQAVTGPEVIIDCGGLVRTIADTWDIQHSVTTIRFAHEDDGLSVNNNVPTITRRGSSEDAVPLESVVAEKPIQPRDPVDWAEDDWIFVVSDDPIDTAGKYTEGWLIQYGQGVTVPVDMTLNPRGFRLNLAPSITIHGGAFFHENRENDYFDPIVEFVGVDSPKMIDSEVAWGGSDGIVQALCVNPFFDVYVHDMLDDEANRHYGYGVTFAQASLGGLVTGHISNCRHAFTTNSIAGHRRLHPDHPNNAGNPRGFKYMAEASGCTSTNVSPHECGWDGVLSFTSRNPGRYQNDHDSTNGKENPDHIANRMRHLTIEDSSLMTDDGVSDHRTVAFNVYDRLVGESAPWTMIDNVVVKMNTGRKVADTRGPVTVGQGGLRVQGGSHGIHVQEGAWVGGPVLLGGIQGNEFIFSAAATGTRLTASSDRTPRVSDSGSDNEVYWQ